MTRYGTEVQRLYELIEKRLAQAPYLGGDDYSIVDIATFPGRAITTPGRKVGGSLRTLPAGSRRSTSGRR